MENKMFLTVLGLNLALSVLTILALLAKPAHAESARTSMQNKVTQKVTWVWSGTSAEVNNATSALASGHHARAVRFASSVTAANPTDQLLTAQTLCLAHLAQHNVDAAEAHCRAALLTFNTMPVMYRRGALVTAEDVSTSSRERFDLGEIVRANISTAYGVVIADNIETELRAELR